MMSKVTALDEMRYLYIPGLFPGNKMRAGDDIRFLCTSKHDTRWKTDGSIRTDTDGAQDIDSETKQEPQKAMIYAEV